MPDDAVFVFCNLTAKGETCIYPDKDRAVLPSYIQWRKEDDNDWYSNLKDGFQVTYDSIGSVQMTFLRLLSQEGYQNFTYKCINSAAWFNAELKNFDSAIKFLGDNEMEIGYDTDKLKPNILVDGCKVRFCFVVLLLFLQKAIFVCFIQSGKSISETIFEVRTTKLSYLPLIDFSPKDYGRPNQAFGFSVGPFCLK